jgi:SNF2 family DNA or RNA helicase
MLDRSDLRGYQDRAISFGKETESCALHLEPGLGKTTSTLTIYKDLREAFEVDRMLVVAPLRVARKVWRDEVGAWSHLQGISTASITGTLDQRMKALRTPADVHTINREQVPWIYNQFVQNKKQTVRWPWPLVVLDESQSFKSQAAERWIAMARLRKLFPRMIQLTGTPMPQGYTDLWAQMFLLDHGKRLGDTEEEYHDRWFIETRYDSFSAWELKPGADTEIKSAVGDIVLAMKADEYLKDLPAVVVNPVRVELPILAAKAYKKLERTSVLELANKTITAVNAGVLAGKLLQAASGALYTDSEGNWEELHTAKLEALEELLEAIGGKVIIAYHFQHDLARIKNLLKDSDRVWKVLKSDRDFQQWADGQFEIGVLHPASAGHGLNDVAKSGAQDMIHFGLNPSLELFQQVNARLTGGHRRAGRNVRIHLIIADNTLDDDYVALLGRKEATQDDFMRALSHRLYGVAKAA